MFQDLVIKDVRHARTTSIFCRSVIFLSQGTKNILIASSWEIPKWLSARNANFHRAWSLLRAEKRGKSCEISSSDDESLNLGMQPFSRFGPWILPGENTAENCLPVIFFFPTFWKQEQVLWLEVASLSPSFLSSNQCFQNKESHFTVLLLRPQSDDHSVHSVHNPKNWISARYISLTSFQAMSLYRVEHGLHKIPYPRLLKGASRGPLRLRRHPPPLHPQPPLRQRMSFATAAPKSRFPPLPSMQAYPPLRGVSTLSMSCLRAWQLWKVPLLRLQQAQRGSVNPKTCRCPIS